MSKHPIASVKEKFGDKEKLVAAVEKLAGEDLWVSRLSDKGLKHVSNAKLLKLHATFTAVKEKFGTRAKLIDALLTAEKRTKDEGYKTRLNAYPVPRLWDMWKSADKRAKGSAPKAKDATAKPAAKAAPAAAKKAAAPKKTAKK